MEEQDFYTTVEIAKKLSVHYRHVKNLITSGKLKAVNIAIGRERKIHRISKEELARYLKSEKSS